jgi:glycogen operon protein
MILMGDEIGHTQMGNNNAFCQDNEISWFDWSCVETNADLLNFFQAMIAFRKAHPVLRQGYFLRGENYLQKGYADVAWHGLKPNEPDWTPDSKAFAFVLGGGYAKGGLENDDHIYVATNMSHEAADFEIPPCPEDKTWHIAVNTSDGQNSFNPVGSEPPLENATCNLLPYSVLILVGR